MATVESASIKQQAIVKKVYQAFFSPSQYEAKSNDQAILERGHNYRIPFEGGELAVADRLLLGRQRIICPTAAHEQADQG